MRASYFPNRSSHPAPVHVWHFHVYQDPRLRQMSVPFHTFLAVRRELNIRAAQFKQHFHGVARVSRSSFTHSMRIGAFYETLP